MKSRKTWPAVVTLAALLLIAATVAPAAEPAAAPGGEQKAGGFGDILDLISKPTFPSLSGLIRPEKMGVLTDNTCQIRDNQIEPELMSGNKTEVLSGIHILSGISVDVRVTIRSADDGRASKVKARKTDDKRPAKKPKKNKTRSRPNEPKPEPKQP